MSPLLDTPATRRDALAGFGALFLALLGMPQFLHEAEAAAIASPADDVAIEGIFVGTVGTERVIVDLLLEATGNAVKVTIRDTNRKRTPMTEFVMLNTQAAGTLIASVGAGMIATTEAARRADPWRTKPLGARSCKPVPVTCPECGGYRSFDCDTCEGAGVVAHWPKGSES